MSKFAIGLLICLGATALSAKPLIIGHRGASAYAPENTVESQQLAWDLNADGAEFDVYLTADKKLMVLHDKDTSRTANGAINLNIKKSVSTELEKVDVGAWKDKTFEGVTLPYLSDMFACHPKGKKLVIEIKDQPDTVPGVKDLIENSGRPLDEFVVISFNLDTCVEARKLMPKATVYFLESANDNPEKKVKDFTEDILKIAKDNNFNGVNLDYRGVTPQLVEKAKAMGLDILVWTVDKKEDVERMAKMGVDAITTNRPDTTRRYVDEALGK